MGIAYRPARPDDLESAVGLVQQAISDLRARHGVALPMPLRPPLSQRFCLQEDPAGLWVAETDGTILGFAMSWMSGRFWYLSQLFVRPEIQAKGIGQALLSRAVQQAERAQAGNRALITFAYNTQSTGLYVRNGLYPREPALRMAAPAAVVAWNLAEAGYEASPIAPSSPSRDWMGRIDEAVLGFRRDPHHAYLLDGGARAVRIGPADDPAGYAYIAADGHLGPLAIAPGADAKAVVAAAIRCALDGQPQQLSMIVPGRAERVLEAVSALGFRIEEPYVLMAAQPFGDWHHYLPSNPGFL